MLYFAHRIHSKNDARIFLLEDMRVDEDTLADLDFSLVKREFLALYREKIDRVDFSRAVEDVQPFLQDPREIEAWSPDFFRALTGHFRFA